MNKEDRMLEISRTKNVNRINAFDTPSLRNVHYLHYINYFKDLKSIFDNHIKKNDRIFDIGCGNKPFEDYIRKLTKKNDNDFYVGCDIIQSSENKADIVCEATKIPETTERYNVIICTQVIEHVFDYQKVFEEAYRLLKSGGKFIVSGPFVFEMHEKPYDFYRFTKYGFEELLTRTGFEIEENVSNGGKWAVLGHLFIHCLVSNKRLKFLLFKIIRGIWNYLVVLLCNLVFHFLDNRNKDSDNFALNYIYVGKKT